MNVLDSFSCKGKVALVTGGAGHQGGFGSQISEALYEAGATVYTASRNVEKLAAFTAQYPGMKFVELDLADEGSIARCIRQIISQEGKLDILVNNAVLRAARGIIQWTFLTKACIPTLPAFFSLPGWLRKI